MMRQAVAVPVDSVFGVALQTLAARKLDVAPIVDKNGVMCGRLEANCVLTLYDSFKLLSNARRPPGTPAARSKEACKVEYANGTYQMPSQRK